MQADRKHAYSCPNICTSLRSLKVQPVSSLKPGRALAFHTSMNRRQSSKALIETYKRAVQGNKESLEEADMPSSRQFIRLEALPAICQQLFLHLDDLYIASIKAQYVTCFGLFLCSDSSPERLDTYLNVESGSLPTESETTGLVSGLDKFKLWAGLEPSPELIAISMGVQTSVIAVQNMIFQLLHRVQGKGQPKCNFLVTPV